MITAEQIIGGPDWEMVVPKQEKKDMGGLETKIKEGITEALREKYLIKKNILRLVVGEVQTIAAL